MNGAFSFNILLKCSTSFFFFHFTYTHWTGFIICFMFTGISVHHAVVSSSSYDYYNNYSPLVTNQDLDPCLASWILDWSELGDVLKIKRSSSSLLLSDSLIYCSPRKQDMPRPRCIMKRGKERDWRQTREQKVNWATRAAKNNLCSHNIQKNTRCNGLESKSLLSLQNTHNVLHRE